MRKFINLKILQLQFHQFKNSQIHNIIVLFQDAIQTQTTLKPAAEGAKWSKNIYLQKEGFKSVEECGGICLIAGNTTCQYYVFVDGTCFLGNVGIQNSIISLRNDIQNTYFLNCMTFTRMFSDLTLNYTAVVVLKHLT